MQTRYARQIVLKEIDEAGQRRIASSTVVVVGLVHLAPIVRTCWRAPA